MQTAPMNKSIVLKFLPRGEYAKVDPHDPLRLYYWPFIGRLYQRRVKMCLAECTGGKRVLEVGFGSGLTFLNLKDIYDEIYGLDLKAPIGEVTEMFKRRGVVTRLIQGSVLQMPYEDGFFDTVLLISILEHLKSEQLKPAFTEIRRVLKKDGQVVYGVPVERPFMVFAFRILGYDIRQHHFSTEKEVHSAAADIFDEVRVESLNTVMGPVYEVGHFVKR